MNTEAWVVFRGKLVADTDSSDFSDLDLSQLDEVVEVVKAEKVSKTYIKLKESPLFHPNISYGDILKVKQCEKSLSDKVTILEFHGIESDGEDIGACDVKNLGTESVSISPNLVNAMKGFNSKIKPIIEDKFKQGLVFEPMKLVSHGSYKINISYEAEGGDLDKMKDHFKEWNVYFQKSTAPNLGSVAFNLDTKFEKAVECLETAPWVKACYLAFAPNDFPQIEFSPDLIPKGEDKED